MRERLGSLKVEHTKQRVENNSSLATASLFTTIYLATASLFTSHYLKLLITFAIPVTFDRKLGNYSRERK
jgi:hypothetical protein